VFSDLETTGLNLLKDDILTIQIKDGYGRRVWCIKDYRRESDLVREFVDYYLEVKDKFLIGYNIANFDLPLLFTRMEEEDLARFFQKYTRGYVRDLAMILEFHKVKRQKLENIAKTYQIDVSKIQGTDIRELHRRGDWEAIIDYAKDELDVIHELFRKMWNQIKRYGHLSFRI